MVDLNQDAGDEAQDGTAQDDTAQGDSAEPARGTKVPEVGSALELPPFVRDTVAKLRRSDPDTVIVGTDGLSTPSTLSQRKQSPAPDGNGRRLGPYEIHKLLGQGGIGMVYRAFDHRLERWVALKLVRADSHAAAQRLLGEAKAQARVDHPNVCQVYEAGEIEGEPFIAMQYLEGRPLGKVYQRMTLREKIEVTRKVAEAIHAAHLQGLIHRDIKPGNVLVEQAESGEWRPYVLDFGLAREVSAPGDTTTGEVKGTPHYMPPEQVTGNIHQLDERADVYSLGATFYEGLVGCTLYPKTTGVAVLVKVLSEDPEPVRSLDKSLPVDVESICMHCLERDPAKRYPSAKALADDLQRFLDFEPVEARKITAFGRLWRKMRKRRVAALTVTLIATVLLSIIFFIASEIRSVQRSAMMEKYRQEVRYNDEFLRHVYSAPLHDVTDQKLDVRMRLANIESVRVKGGRIAQGPKNYALGRGYMALHEYDKAHQYLKEAWRLGTRDPEVAYALGRTLGALFEQELRAAKRMDNERAKQTKLQEIRDEYRQPALEFLSAGRDVESESAELVEALMLFWEERFDEALRKAEAAHKRVPWLYEAEVLQAHIYVALGTEYYAHGDNEDAAGAFRRAQQLYDEASQIGRSDAEIYEGQCNLGSAMMQLSSYALLGSLEESFEYGSAACERAKKVDPEREQPYLLQSILFYRMGESELYQGINPTEKLTQAAELAAEVLKRDPKSVEALASQGWAYNMLAQWPVEYGGDPRASAARALDLFRGSVALDPQFAQGYNGQGYARYLLARWQIENGVVPGPTLAASIDDFQTAIVIEPAYFYPYDTLANTYVVRARWQLWQGQDPQPSVLGTEDVTAQMQELNPRWVWGYSTLGDALEMRARFLVEAGRDPMAVIERARVVYVQADKVSPIPWIDIGQARLDLAEALWLEAHGRNATDVFDRALQRLEEAAQGSPEENWVWQSAADVCRAKAAASMARGEPSRKTIERGLRMVERALDINPTLTEVQAVGANLRLMAAQLESSPSRRAEAEHKARRDLQDLLERNGNLRRRYGS